jgi:DNA polymerase-3 subunit beta
MARLLPSRSTQPAHAGVVVTADDLGLLLVAADGELTVQFRVRATTHDPGDVVVSRRAMTETLAALTTPEVRLVVEGHRLAVRMPGARFALPRLGNAQLTPAGLPPMVGTVVGAELAAAAVPVAGAASREHALPIFTGVRLRSRGDCLSLVATDRYRLACASVPWQPVDTEGVGTEGVDTERAVEALVPAAVFAEACKQAGRADAVRVHAGGDLFGLAWDGGSIVTSTLGDAFPDAQLDRLVDVTPECVIEVESDALAAAVDRAGRCGGVHGRVAVQAVDGAVLIRASDPLSGESEETVKATVRGGHLTRCYQARLLSDALRPTARHTVQLRIQADLRPTAITGTGGPAAAVDLRYLVVPMRPATPSHDAT